ncbi:transposase [Salmonella enterica subsp. diarizonae]|nr:transposase [Salmonella enterica subsp. diarizonae]
MDTITGDRVHSPAQTRLSVRKEKSQPLMQSLYDWIQAQLKTLSVHAEMAKAFGYMLKQYDALNVFSAATVGWRSTTTSVKTPYGAWRWAGLTICSSAQTGAARQRRSSTACWVCAN